MTKLLTKYYLCPQMVRQRVWKYRQKDHWLYLEEAEAVSLHDRLTKTVVRAFKKTQKTLRES